MAQVNLGRAEAYFVKLNDRWADAAYCPKCQRKVLNMKTNTCPVCTNPIKKKNPPNKGWVKRFEECIRLHQYDIDSWFPYNQTKDQPRFRIRLGFFDYDLPIRYFLEFVNLQYADEDHGYDRFFEFIRYYYGPQ